MFRYAFVIIILFSALIGYQSIELYDRLNNLIDYVQNHEESQKPDLMLGIYLCEAQLMIIYSNESDSYTKLSKALENVKMVREKYENRVEKGPIWESNVYNSIVVRHLLNLNFWVTSLQANNDSPFFGNLLSTNYALSLNLENFYENIDGGSPTPTESDECLAELLNSNHQCVISKRCLLIMSLNNTAHGYHLTHKLLFFMLLKYRNCGSCIPVDGMSLDFMIHTLCAMVWHERNLIIEMDMPNQLRDLLMEQTLLCGLNGYAAFMDEEFVRELVQWQIESGCFEWFSGTLPAEDVNTERVKRHVTHLKDNCSDHATGLAAAVFGLFAKVSNQFRKVTI